MKLLLCDANALIHRAFHAIPPNLKSPSGEPTNATYGFTSTLLKVLKDEQPDYVAVAFDVGRTFRDDLYADYKAGRPATPSDLAIQLQRSRDVCEAFGFPVYERAGFEADDLLGTLSRQATAQNLDTVIVTGDTDTFQLIGPRVRVLTFSRQFGETVMYDEEAIQKRYALTPRQLIDYKALKGDPSDNIPGVPGVGEKTAAKLLQTFGTVEELYAHLAELDAKTREKLEAAREQVVRGKKLVTIVSDVPARLDLDAARVKEYDRERVLKLFRELGFRSLLNRLGETAETAPEIKPTTTETREHYHIVNSEKELKELVGRIKQARAFTFDVETTGTDAFNADLVGLAIGLGEGEAYYIPIGHGAAPTNVPANAQMNLFEAATGAKLAPGQLPLKTVVEKLAPLFADAQVRKFAHNAKYDVEVLEQAGIRVDGLAFDTMLAAHLLEPASQSLGLKSLVFTRFGVEMTEIEKLIGKGKTQVTMAAVPIADAARYACADVDYTHRLMQVYRPMLVEHGLAKLFETVELPLVPVLVEMERAGVLIDEKALAELSRELYQRLQALEKEIYALAGHEFNVGSPQQLAEVLFGKLQISKERLPRTKSGHVSTAADVLESLRDAHPVVNLILEHRELAKLKGTYVDALPLLINRRTGRIHTSYNQTGTVTGRISSSDPNLQNIPVRTDLGRRVRRAFIALPGSVLISADYSQVELRILAHITHDEKLLETFARGEDIHASTAAFLFNVPLDQVSAQMRRLGKTINFAILYGSSDWGVAARTELSQEDARKFIENYFAQHPKVQAYVERTKQMAREKGYVETLLGRRRYFPELATMARSPAARQAEREAVNMPIQGSAADVIKVAMLNLARAFKERGLKSQMTLQVHDELVLECPESEVDTVALLAREIMEHAYELDAKLLVDVSVGKNWDEMEKYG